MKILLFDLSKTLLFPADESYTGSLNGLHREMSSKPDYNFLDHFTLDTEALDYFKTLKHKYVFYMFTSEAIQNAKEIKGKLDKVFERIFSGEEMGLDKKEPKSYEKIADELKVKTNEITFIDDSEANIDAAKKSGMDVISYKNLADLKKHLK